MLYVLEDVHALHRFAGIVDYAVQVVCVLWADVVVGVSATWPPMVTIAASYAAYSAVVSLLELLVWAAV